MTQYYNDTPALTETEIKKIRADVKANEIKTWQQFRAEFPDDLEFAVEQFGNGATLQEAKGNFLPILQAKIEAEKQKKAAREAMGAKPLSAGGEGGDGLTGDLMETAKELAKSEGITLKAALRKIAKEQPEIHKQYLRNQQASSQNRETLYE